MELKCPIIKDERGHTKALEKSLDWQRWSATGKASYQEGEALLEAARALKAS
jgi:hypothetical protein